MLHYEISLIYLQTPSSVPLYVDIKEINNRPKAPPSVQANVTYSEVAVQSSKTYIFNNVLLIFITPDNTSFVRES